MRNDFLLSVEKPARYMGRELGAITKTDAKVRFVLAFPDVYEVGMSHLGLQILYGILNSEQWVTAERVYAPWPDMEDRLRLKRLPLATLETSTPLAETDIIGFTLQYELSYSNILNMLELASIPLLASTRRKGFPLILGGGPCACNPEPIADFFDAFLLGDGEDAVLEIADAYRQWKQSGEERKSLLHRLSLIEGVYVPSFFSISYDPAGQITAINPLKTSYRTVRRRIATDLDATPYPTSPVVPFLKIIHDRVSMEIARGCTRGCRFCQAGYIYRPLRERSPSKIIEMIEETLRNTGYDEISLLSLSAGDYSCIKHLLQELMRRYSEERIAVSLPSLRVGSLTPEMIAEINKVRKTGFTLAPEAGSERLRQVINKGISEVDLLDAAFQVYTAGWRLIKLYFMIGLPTETMEDIIGIAELSKQVKFQGKRARHGGEVNVAISTLVPKANTPFQWEPQISHEKILEKQQVLRQEFRKRKLSLKWHDAPLTVMEGVFARGDRRLGKVLLEARRLGCRFDGWSEHFNFKRWQDAFVAAGIDPLYYQRQRDFDEILPWDHLDSGISKEFLLAEREKAIGGIYTLDCRNGNCSRCGVCDFKTVRMRLNGPGTIIETGKVKRNEIAGAELIRLRFQKTGRMRFLSHLEMLNLFIRTVGRARIPVHFSQGFHPHPKFSFATALSVGVESWAEYMDMEVDAGFGAERLKDALNSVLPEGVRIMESKVIPLKSDSLSVIITGTSYRIKLPPGVVQGLEEQVEKFLRLESFLHYREKKDKLVEIDLRREVISLTATTDALLMEVRRGKPLEFAAAITGLPDKILGQANIEKLEVKFN